MRPLNHEEISAEFSSYLRVHHPELLIIEVSSESLVLDVAEVGEHKLMLHRLQRAIGRLEDASPQAREAEYRHFLALMLPDHSENIATVMQSPDVQTRIYPKLVREDFLHEVRRQTGQSDLAHRPFYQTGLLLIYVLDFPDRVAYLLRPLQDDLGLNDAQLHAVALDNARVLLPRDDLRAVLADPGALSFWDCSDGHNSARLIVAPEHLEAGEIIVALLPDKNSLLLASGVQSDEDWQSFNTLASDLAAEGEVPFLARALRVTFHDVEVM